MTPTPSEANDGPTTGSSKSSLLWAYQLRKEHIHLVNRIEDVNSDLLSCSSKVSEQHHNLSNLETLVKTLQADNYTLKNEVTTVRDRFAASLDRVHKQISSVSDSRDIKEESLAKLTGDFERMERRISEMTQGMLELKMGMVSMQKKCDCLAKKQIELALWQDQMPPPKKPNSTVKKGGKGYFEAGIRSSLVICLKYGKTAAQEEDNKRGNSATQMTTVHDTLVDDASILTTADSLIPDSMPTYTSLPLDSIFQKIKQGDRDLYDYFTFAAEVRSELPRRKQEGHIVEAFFDGLAGDNAVKTAMEEYLDALGWIWNNVECFCRRDQREYNTRSRTRANKVHKL